MLGRHVPAVAGGGRCVPCCREQLLGVFGCYVCAGNGFTYQITLSTTDLLLHSSFDPKGKVSPMDVLHTQFNSIMVRPALQL
jgi:hypothetical protein